MYKTSSLVSRSLSHRVHWSFRPHKFLIVSIEFEMFFCFFAWKYSDSPVVCRLWKSRMSFSSSQLWQWASFAMLPRCFSLSEVQSLTRHSICLGDKNIPTFHTHTKIKKKKKKKRNITFDIVSTHITQRINGERDRINKKKCKWTETINGQFE